MNALAFAMIAGVFAMYVVLDGYDFGVATITPFVARSPAERALSMEAIGPYWNGNEVFLIAGGGMLFALFPQVYASSFSGFYLPFIVVLWLLMFRGISIELRRHIDSELWHGFWDAAFALSSVLLSFVFGVAIANVVRGVPLDAAGYFRGTFAFLLNPYALLAGAFSVVALAYHGATFLAMRTRGNYAGRVSAFADRLWWAAGILFVAVTGATYLVRSLPLWGPLDLLFVAAVLLFGGQRFAPSRGPARFALNSLFLLTLLAAAACTIFPYLLPAFPNSAGGLTIYAGAPSQPAMAVALSVFAAGLAIVAAYGLYLLRQVRGTVGN